MNDDLIFLFDLDSTITKVEILPEISKMIIAEKEMRQLTEDTMKGVIPFQYSFLKRVEILKNIDVNIIAEEIAKIPLNENIVNFIRSNRKKCYVVTGNLDVWIWLLMKRIGMEEHCICSRTHTSGNKLEGVISVLDKGKEVEQFVHPFVAIGDGDNDSEMARLSKIAIGFGGVRDIAPSLLANIDYAFYDEKCLTKFLWKLVQEE